MNKLRILAAVALMAFQAFTAIPNPIRFGTNPTFPPFEYKLPSGEIVGFEIDLAHAICAQLGIKMELVETDFDALIPALKARKFDAILSGMSVNAKRMEQINFTTKMFHGPCFLVVKKDSGLNPTAESLKGKNIGVQQGTTWETYAQKHWAPNGVNIVSYKTSDLARADLTAGRLDGMIDDPFAAEKNFFSKPEGKDYMLAKPNLVDPTVFGVGAAIGVRKEDTELQQKLSEAILTIRKNGTYGKINNKYFNLDMYGD